MSEGPTRDDGDRARALMEQAESGRRLTDDGYRRQSRRSFVTGAAATGVAALAWRWVQTQPSADNIPRVLRAGHEVNERLWRALSSSSRGAREYSVDRAEALRVNGLRGLMTDLDTDAWRLVVRDRAGDVLDELTLDDVQRHEHLDMVTEHKCIEGWSTITRWTGVRFSDFARAYDDEVASTRYVSLSTPGNGYYVGLERATALHRQTLLCWALQGEPLTADHGAPLRLVTPNHYGIKSIKRIGTIQFTNDRPRDYWAERGYGWYLRF